MGAGGGTQQPQRGPGDEAAAARAAVDARGRRVDGRLYVSCYAYRQGLDALLAAEGLEVRYRPAAGYGVVACGPAPSAPD